MKIGKIQAYSLAGLVTLAAGGFGIKKYVDYRLTERRQGVEAIEYIKTNAPKEYENLSEELDTTYRSYSYNIDKFWISNAKRIRDSLQVEAK